MEPSHDVKQKRRAFREILGLIVLALGSVVVVSYCILVIVLPSLQSVASKITRSTIPDEQDRTQVLQAIVTRAALFDVTDFIEEPGYEPGGKISYINVFFKLRSKAVIQRAIISAYLTQQGHPDIIFTADHIDSLEADLMPDKPQSVDFQIKLNQSVLRPRFNNGPFLLQVDISSDEYGWVELSGNRTDQDNLSMINKCPPVLFFDKDYGPYNCPVYVHKEIPTRQYSIEEFAQ